MPGKPAMIFDMDGTLVDNMDYHIKSWMAFLEAHNIQMSREAFIAYNHGNINQVIRRIFPHIKDPDRLHKLGQEKEEIYRALYGPFITEIEGLSAFLALLKNKGWKIGLATMGDQPNIDFTLDALGLTESFEAIVGGHEVSQGKPAPDIFNQCMELLSSLPEETFIVEDTSSGVAAAIASGCRVIGMASTMSKNSLLNNGCLLAVQDFTETELITLIENPQKSRSN